MGTDRRVKPKPGNVPNGLDRTMQLRGPSLLEMHPPMPSGTLLTMAVCPDLQLSGHTSSDALEYIAALPSPSTSDSRDFSSSPHFSRVTAVKGLSS
ncbi:hypothetical protein P7K49_027901 [Saguinus oedipus]|uniref:Uncharacterized protein n=1 Tax=Saguinus oedipus TaxID=9490 RepID=A0ABQ9UC16_SAGOE|nr:hypothetical protein P7K49_027901 [Saguinus oedipus]